MTEAILKFFGISLKPVEEPVDSVSVDITTAQTKSYNINKSNPHIQSQLQQYLKARRDIQNYSSSNEYYDPTRYRNQNTDDTRQWGTSPNVQSSTTFGNNPRFIKLVKQLGAKVKLLKQNSDKILEMKPMLDSISKDIELGKSLSNSESPDSQTMQNWKSECEQARRLFIEFSEVINSDGNQAQLLKYMQDESILDEDTISKRNLAIRQIEKDTQDILITTKILNEILDENTEKYDRIDLKLSSTLQHSRATNKNIRSIEKHHRFI